jgi:hypothetical protein
MGMIFWPSLFIFSSSARPAFYWPNLDLWIASKMLGLPHFVASSSSSNRSSMFSLNDLTFWEIVFGISFRPGYHIESSWTMPLSITDKVTGLGIARFIQTRTKNKSS